MEKSITVHMSAQQYLEMERKHLPERTKNEFFDGKLNWIVGETIVGQDANFPFYSLKQIGKHFEVSLNKVYQSIQILPT